MDIGELTIKQAKELASMFSGCAGVAGTMGHREPRSHGFEVDKKYFIRTVTHHYIGMVEEICDLCIIMKKVAWIADDGRFHQAVRGKWTDKAEHETYPEDTPVQVFYGAILDASEWIHDVIMSEK